MRNIRSSGMDKEVTAEKGPSEPSGSTRKVVLSVQSKCLRVFACSKLLTMMYGESVVKRATSIA